MSLSTVLFLFLAHLGVGIIFTLVFVSREAGVKFFRFNAGLASILLIVAEAFRRSAPTPIPAALDRGELMHIVAISTYSMVALLVATFAIVIYWATIGRIFTRIRGLFLGTAVIAGIAALVLEGLALSSGRSGVNQAMTVASFLTSAGLLGGACTAMILGHWYFVLPSMDVGYLQSMVKWHMVSMVLRIIVVAAAVAIAIATYQPGLGLPSFRRYILSVDGIFFWQRVLFGLAGPAVLSYLTWETAKIRSTQSATGILYVDLFTVVVGEILAKYILLATHVPV